MILSIMCIQASMHVRPPSALPCPSGCGTVRPMNLLIKAAELTRTGIGLPAYYNDEVIIPALHEPGINFGRCPGL